MVSIRGRRVVLPDGERPATIRFEEGVIVEIGDGVADMDVGDMAILPGLVDSHVHVNEPGRTDWEGFATATDASVAGGTTTIVDMPLNSIPPTVDTAALEEKRLSAGGKLAADVAFWGGIVPGSLDGVADLTDAGVCGFKVFTVDSGVPEFPPLSPAELGEAAVETARLGVPLLVHAEDPARLREPAGDPRRYATYLASRPGSAEAAAIRQVAALAREAGTDVHVLHVSGVEAIEALREDRVDGHLTAETCPHYLTFDADAIPDGATAFKCAPPIRSRDDREALWEALTDGTIEMIVSDHSPSPPASKDVEGGDFLAAWGGIASLELRLAATWTQASGRGCRLSDLARWLASAPARMCGLAPAKGEIAPGGDADLVVFDPDGVTEVSATSLRQRHPLTPYDGLRLRGGVAATFLRGVQVQGVGGATGRHGRLLRRGA